MWAGEPGRYEVWFLTMSAPDGRSGYWIRYTVRAPVAGPPEARVWFSRVERDDPSRTLALNVAEPAGLRYGEDGFEIRIGESILRSGRAAGQVSGAGHDAAWDLEFDTGEPTYHLLPKPFYRGTLAPTKPYTPNTDLRYRGTVEVDGETVLLDGAPGQQGHLYGTRHAERWAWAFCNAFEDDGAVFQALSAQSRRGPLVTPPVTFAGLRLDGEWIRFRGFHRRRTWGLGIWGIDLRSRGHRLEGEVRAEPKEMIRTRYLDPDGTPRWCHNSVVSSCRLVVSERTGRGRRDVRELRSDGTTHAEWAGRTAAEDVGTVHTEIG